MAFQIQVSHGSDKHTVEIQSTENTVADLKHILLTLTEVPSEFQKVIFKGKTLQDDSKLLCDIGIKQGSRLMMLGRKSIETVTVIDPSSKEVDKVNSTVDGIEKKLQGITEEISGIEKGFVQTELISGAARGLHKRCLVCGELLMQNLEKLDAIMVPPTETLIKGKKKSVILRIQSLLTRNDDLIKRIDASKNK